MLDRVGKEAFVMLVAVALGFFLGGPIGATICFVLAAMIALVLWTPLRGWLGIPTKERVAASPDDIPAAHTARHNAKINVVNSPHKGFRRISDASDDSEISLSDSPTTID